MGGEDRQNGVRSDGDRAVVLQNKVPPASHSGGCRSSRIPTRPPRRAQCSFDGSAVKSAFALLLAKVTKPAAAAAKGISIKLPHLGGDAYKKNNQRNVR